MKVITTVAGVKVLRSFAVGDQFLGVNIKGQCHEIFEPFLVYQVHSTWPLRNLGKRSGKIGNSFTTRTPFLIINKS